MLTTRTPGGVAVATSEKWDDDYLLTRTDFAKVLRIHRNTFGELYEKGQILDPTLYVGDQPRWRWGDVREWIRRGGHRPRQVLPDDDGEGEPPKRKRGTTNPSDG